MSLSLRIGIVQHNPLVGDITGNAEQIAREYSAITDRDPDLVVTPELSLIGYPPRDLLHRQAVVDEQMAALNTLAEETAGGPPLVVGATLRNTDQTGGVVHNGAVFLQDGQVTDTYHKRLLPTYDVFDEHRYFQPGSEPTVVSVSGVDIGLTICEDAWHDAVVNGKRRHGRNPLSETAQRGADLLVTLSASPFSLDKPMRRERRFLEHAETTGCPVVFANQVGGNDELIFDGHSLVAESGGIIDRLGGFEAETAVIEVPLEKDSRKHIERYELPTAAQAREALGLGLRDYFKKTGFQEALIGLSGGIDSSVTAALATDALGADNVYGISMPTTVTSQQSIDDARAVAENLGISFDVVPVGEATDSFHELLEEYAEGLTGVAAENIQARVRGDILMGLANQRTGLVLTPDNKSEAAVGYCTLYGDTVGALAPLGDCYKRVVYELARAFNEIPPDSAGTSPVIPASVIEKAPTAELREGQNDADDLPPYEQLDPLLEGYIEQERGSAELREQYPEEIVDDAVSRLTRAEFKRRQTPPPLRITKKALGRGWQYPVAAEYEHVTGGDSISE